MAGINIMRVVLRGNFLSDFGKTKDITKRVAKKSTVNIWVILLTSVSGRLSGKAYVKNMVNNIPKAVRLYSTKYLLS